MPRIELDLNPVTYITTDAIGKPGERVFYLQGRQGEQIVTLLVEKVQVQSLAIGVEQFLDELKEKYPDLPEPTEEFQEEPMHIHPPVDPLFRIGELGLGYDADRELAVLIAKEIVGDGENADDAGVVRFWCTRSQLKAMCRWGLILTNRGRPICPQCGEPMDVSGHFCPKKNGHKH
ncbi:MAG TPA: DUF3090 domain-containing protein [Anaerolineaceae bacterium]|jgi:uncharacterized repeat protein (TIGR03847 family)